MRPDVDYVSIKVSATVPPVPRVGIRRGGRVHNRAAPAALHAGRECVDARSSSTWTWRNTAYLDLTIAVFMAVLDRAELLGLEAGIVLQAYLPDALSAMRRLQAWAADRRAAWRGVHQGPPGQRRQPADGAGRGLAARLAARHLGNETGHRCQLQARLALGDDAGAAGERPARGGRSQPVRRCLHVGAGRSAGSAGPRSSSRCC